MNCSWSHTRKYDSIALDFFAFFLHHEWTKVVSCTICEGWDTFQSIFWEVCHPLLDYRSSEFPTCHTRSNKGAYSGWASHNPITARPNLVEHHSFALLLGALVVVLDNEFGHMTSFWQNYGMFNLISVICILSWPATRRTPSSSM